ncbi:bifunctional class I SAM-dependent methyltransferase/NUDIX hydrolase [Streptomyces sp. NBC_00162]|uniref:bifunctional class I SAM-dependent methyltransferase/NUDIX hydrolase n=1 Tax=Streptomyces sp. NBC_00162 TaxID=2903629 RepID=UPI002AFFAA9A|nr:NUDIX domain-containing protein [Streptomyces sp. NBC_00162]
MGYVRQDEWHEHYAAGKGFRPLRERERALLTEHVPAPEGGRALELGCGTGELAVFLAGLGYQVDAVDYAASAVDRARAEHAGAGRVRWLELDIETGDAAGLSDEGYDVITLRLVYPFLRDRTRILHGLGERLRPGGTVVVITPLKENTPEERRDIALDEAEIGVLTSGWEHAGRLPADELAMLVLRGPCHAHTTAAEKGPTTGHALTGAYAMVTDPAGRVLLGRSTRGMWELPGGKNAAGEGFEAAAVRELAEETGLLAAESDAHLLSVLLDDAQGLPRLTAVVRIAAWSGEPANREPMLFERWEWHDPHSLACLGPVFTPTALALNAVWPGIIRSLPPVRAYEATSGAARAHRLERHAGRAHGRPPLISLENP